MGSARRAGHRGGAFLLLAAVFVPRGWAQEAERPPAAQAEAQEAGDTEKRKRPRRRLVLDIEKHVERKLEEEAKKGLLRFETSVEVVGKSPQVMLERFFGGVDLECAPAGAPPGGGAPTVAEMREARPTLPETADLLALASALAGKLKGRKQGDEPARYYLYRVRRDKEVSYALRDERVPDAWLYRFPGTTFELLETFSKEDDAVRAWRRMERGFKTPVAPAADPAPSWVTVDCRPRRD